jgi:hypothetical protein
MLLAQKVLLLHRHVDFLLDVREPAAPIVAALDEATAYITKAKAKFVADIDAAQAAAVKQAQAATAPTPALVTGGINGTLKV